MATLTRRERSLIGLGMVTVVIIAADLYVVEPLLASYRAVAELTPARKATLDGRRHLIAQRERLAAEGAALAAQLEAAATRLLPGPTAPLAASELQRVAKGAATTASVEVRSERVLPPTDLQGLVEIPIELTVAGSIQDTVTLLSQLEAAPRLITIRDVKIRVVAPGQARNLMTTLTICGYLRPS